MIVVTAAAGQTGTAVVRALRRQGLAVRAVVRATSRVPTWSRWVRRWPPPTCAGPADVLPLLAGADALYLIWPNVDPAEATGAEALLGAARQAAVGRVVYHSVLRPRRARCPTMRRRTGSRRRWTARGWPGGSCNRAPTPTTSTAGGGRGGDGVLPQRLGLERAQSFVDLRDVAEAAAVLLTGTAWTAARSRPPDPSR